MRMLGIDVLGATGIPLLDMVTNLIPGAGDKDKAGDAKAAQEAARRAQDDAKAAQASATMYRNVAFGVGALGVVGLATGYISLGKKGR